MSRVRPLASLLLFAAVGCTNPAHVLLTSNDIGTDASAGGDAHFDPREGGCVPADACPPPPRPCSGDRECGPRSVCVAGKCASCDAVSNSCDVQCLAGWESIPVIRNGCPACQCVPPQGCTSDANCAPGEVCYAGQACPPDCQASPACCRGNQCSAPGCPDTRMSSCALVGCPYGMTCDDICTAPLCRCDPPSGRWLCDPGCGPFRCH